MATSTYPGYRSPGAALVRLYEDGTVEVASATQDIGTGTYTTMAQVAAEALGLPVAVVRSKLGDSRLPPAPVSGGSMTTASVTPAVRAAAENALKKLVQRAIGSESSPFYGSSADEVVDVRRAYLFRIGLSDRLRDVRARILAPSTSSTITQAINSNVAPVRITSRSATYS